ncbi:MAG: cbb3-type cytochrome oxidase assembly protein CcoS [Saprospiraceae bacterium]|nr:cbb3-type cytochrome oxidase assembly protein CcoS [Saprospiraceae bacterium]
MKIILLLIIISLCIAGGFLIAFFWAVKDGQYDDDYTPSMRILIDDDMLPSELITENYEFTIKETKPQENV